MLSHGQDPFNSFWFIDPLSWLGKITMPGGYTPPLDDGNKHEIRTASILRWRTVYGDGTVGKRFSWIANELNSSTNGIGLNNNLYLVELAIPRTDQDILPPSSYGNTQPSQTGENGKQQIVIRRANNQYVLLNGESGDAIIRGEGHEQGDNMQLLYNVGDISYLMDSGYDRVETETRLWDWIKGDTWSKSNWNNYRDHNVSVGFPPFLDIKNGYESSGELNVGGYFGGIEYPDLDGTRVNSNHHSTEELYLQTNGNIDILNGKTSLFTYDRNGNKYEFGDYRRRAIFINDGSDSYLIDMNMLETDGGVTGNGNWLLHSYHINSQTLKYNPESDGFSLFQNIDQRQNKHLFLFPARVERDAVGDGAVSIFDDTAEEEFQDNKSIKRVDIWAGNGFDPRLSRFHTTVSFLKPLSISDQELNNKSEHFSELPTSLFNGSLDDLEDRSHQAWYWQQDANTVDVIVKRSKVNMTRYNRRIDLRINENGVTTRKIRLQAGKDYGFARLHKSGGNWEIDSDYQINIEMLPLSVSISGPSSLNSGQLGSWSANVSNAKGSVSYEWYYKKEDWSGYVLGGTSATFTHAFSTSEPDQSAVKVEVSSAGETTYDVQSVEVNGCVGGFDSQTISPDRKVPPCKVAPESEAVPETFSMESNYPNPFNPSTTIKFALPEQAEVTLNVYNILGQKVATLLNETRSAGYYEVRFDASRLASGVYIGRLIATGESGKPFVKELKMQLVK